MGKRGRRTGHKMRELLLEGNTVLRVPVEFFGCDETKSRVDDLQFLVCLLLNDFPLTYLASYELIFAILLSHSCPDFINNFVKDNQPFAMRYYIFAICVHHESEE